ncbi:TauD/TfdA family dioxygenase [Parvibaculum sp.]|jgi:hypothetical protein|uniref:TauD/TfdA family dioxygenase n=1 Tax=Parvibaculum sp. TaxID=2024848 RepID=UPI000C60A843|nr:TauD/TfdA family dioxygenase [Parvibaculum sp.]MAM95213.1 taurine catabolism dioxygenase TauD [Parvibaculum sp.]HCX69149.1 taurine catabolism dioxygenase TauD [Rhodobiaceae bacterium]|tara:strand:+ start:12369 stop:13391 length:1023 start_codon:yes stop_codon:yes gene_type:complete
MKKVAAVSSKADWRGRDMRQTEDWIYHLSSSEIREIDAALRHAKSKGLSGIQVARQDFPLPTFAATIDKITDELANGRGFILIRGFPAQDYSKEDAGTIFWGLGTHIGRPWPQNAQGDVLGDVRDTGRSILDHTVRGYQTRVALPFHTDGSDLVGLLCLRSAKSGGLSSIVSSVACHNELARTRPDLLARHYEPFYYDWRGEQEPGTKPYYAAPTFTLHQGRLFNRYIRGYIDSAQRIAEVPRLTAFEREALDALDALTVNEEFRLDMELRVGDMQFINNYVTFHSRTDYVDHEEDDKKRHLKRLWLATDKIGERPAAFQDRGYDMNWWSQNAPKLPAVK